MHVVYSDQSGKFMRFEIRTDEMLGYFDLRWPSSTSPSKISTLSTESCWPESSGRIEKCIVEGKRRKRTFHGKLKVLLKPGLCPRSDEF